MCFNANPSKLGIKVSFVSSIAAESVQYGPSKTEWSWQSDLPAAKAIIIMQAKRVKSPSSGRGCWRREHTSEYRLYIFSKGEV